MNGLKITQDIFSRYILNNINRYHDIKIGYIIFFVYMFIVS